jgi:hypothetical protein
MDELKDVVKERVSEISSQYVNGKLIIKRFPQEDTTIPKIRQWIDRYRKKTGIRFDMIIVDYLDCIESHKKTADQNQAELVIVKAFESMAADYDIPCWTALQTNRSGFSQDRVGHAQMGGSIKRAQKTHFLMSVNKTPEQKEAGLANVEILKARFAQDGQFFEDIIFSNDDVKISFGNGNRRKADTAPDSTDIEKFNNLIKLKSMSQVNDDSEIGNDSEVINSNIKTDMNISVDDELKKLRTNNDFSPDVKNKFQDALNKMSSEQNVKK